jgi:hypothetical protein
VGERSEPTCGVEGSLSLIRAQSVRDSSETRIGGVSGVMALEQLSILSSGRSWACESKRRLGEEFRFGTGWLKIKISCGRQHRTRPRKKREDGAPAAVAASAIRPQHCFKMGLRNSVGIPTQAKGRLEWATVQPPAFYLSAKKKKRPAFPQHYQAGIKVPGLRTWSAGCR